MSNVKKEIGKITAATFGYGGYQDAMIGLSVTFGSESGWGVSDFCGMWATERDRHCKWTEADRDKAFAKAVRLLWKTLKDAKKPSVEKLKGTPVEVTFEGNSLKSWRVLTEVI